MGKRQWKGQRRLLSASASANSSANAVAATPKTVNTVDSQSGQVNEDQAEIKPPPVQSGLFIPVDIDSIHAHTNGRFHPHRNFHSNIHPISTSHVHPRGIPNPIQPQTQQQTHHQHQANDLNPHQYNVADFNPIMALDAFAYGAINENDFETAYHSVGADGHALDAYGSMIF